VAIVCGLVIKAATGTSEKSAVLLVLLFVRFKDSRTEST
jgi:hypothetical protein